MIFIDHSPSLQPFFEPLILTRGIGGGGGGGGTGACPSAQRSQASIIMTQFIYISQNVLMYLQHSHNRYKIFKKCMSQITKEKQIKSGTSMTQTVMPMEGLPSDSILHPAPPSHFTQHQFILFKASVIEGTHHWSLYPSGWGWWSCVRLDLKHKVSSSLQNLPWLLQYIVLYNFSSSSSHWNLIAR